MKTLPSPSPGGWDRRTGIAFGEIPELFLFLTFFGRKGEMDIVRWRQYCWRPPEIQGLRTVSVQTPAHSTFVHPIKSSSPFPSLSRPQTQH
jgi:hypothetical protein